jgi:iron complex transport system ATP-binding protein
LNKPLLHTENLAIGHGRTTLIAELNLSIFSGEIVGLKGRNGKGKTTLLKTIGGLLKPMKGKVMFDGKDIHHLSPIVRAKCISLVLTQRISLQGITVIGLVEMGRYPNEGRLHFSRKEENEIVRSSLIQLGIEHLASKPLSEISDGEMQKAMIARALAQQTPLILMDEPTAFLDYVAKEELFTLMKSLVKNSGISILFSSHDIPGMESVADRIIEL